MDMLIPFGKLCVRFLVEVAVERMFETLQLSINSQVKARLITIGKLCLRFLVEVTVDWMFKRFELSLTSQVQEGTELGVEGSGVEGRAGGDKDMGGGAGEVEGGDMWVV